MICTVTSERDAGRDRALRRGRLVQLGADAAMSCREVWEGPLQLLTEGTLPGFAEPVQKISLMPRV